MSAQGMLMDVKRMAIHDGPGVRTTLFLKGCPLRCIWCHNPEGMDMRPQLAFYAHKCMICGECASICPESVHRMGENGHQMNRAACAACGACESACLGDAIKLYGRLVSVEEAMRIALEDRAFYGADGGVTLSGGEPMMQPEFLRAFLTALKKEGLHTAVDTCGCAPWSAYESILPLTDMFLYDIKHIDPQQHRLLTGRGNEQILENLRRLSDSGARIEIRMPLVPGCNDDEPTLLGIGRFLSGLNIERMKVLPYHSLARSKYLALDMKDTMPQVDPPAPAAVREACRLLRSQGVHAVSDQD